MILSENIPQRASTFLTRCRRDVLHGRFARNPDHYLEFLIEATRAADPGILEYLRVPDRAAGEPRYHGQGDHIVPQAVWVILMPDDLLGPRAPDGYSAVISNLFWRDPHFNVLDTKRDEGMLFAGIPVDPLTLDKRVFASHVGTNWLVPETGG